MAYYTNEISLVFFDEAGKPSRDLAEYAYNAVIAALQAKEYDFTNRRDEKHPSKRLIDDMSLRGPKIYIDGSTLGYFPPANETMDAAFLLEIKKMVPNVGMALRVETWETYSGSSIDVRYTPSTDQMEEVYHLWNNDGYDCTTTTIYSCENNTLKQISRVSEDNSRGEREDCDGLSFVFYDGFEQDFEEQYRWSKYCIFREIFEDCKGGIIDEELTDETDYFVFDGDKDLEEKNKEKYEKQKLMIEKARELGIEIISSKEFFERFLDIEYELERY